MRPNCLTCASNQTELAKATTNIEQIARFIVYSA